MSGEALPTQFGRAEFYKEFDHHGGRCLVVVEVWKGRRWIILYRLQEQGWVVSSRYAVCGPDGLLAWIRQEYAPRWYYGASVDGEEDYIVVEKGDRVWLLCFDGDMAYFCLFDKMEIPALDTVAYTADQYMEILLEDTSVVQLREILPVLASICEVYLIDSVNEKIAYMVEDTGYLRRLFRYLWVGESWHREGPFEAVDREQWDDISQRITDISGIFEGRVGLETMRIVVEDGVILRWWHSYSLQADGWVLCKTHHAVVEGSDDDIGFVNEFDSSAVPVFVGELDDEVGSDD